MDFEWRGGNSDHFPGRDCQGEAAVMGEPTEKELSVGGRS